MSEHLTTANKLSENRISPRDAAIKFGTLIALALLVGFNLIFTRNFTSINTLFLIIRQTTSILFMTVGMTFVIASGGIDISTGSMMAFAGIIVAKGMVQSGGNFWVFSIIALVACGLIGAFNGLLIAKVNVQPIILTLVMQIMMRGIVLLYSESTVMFLDAFPIISFIGLHKIGGEVPIQLVYFVVIAVAGILFVKKATLGKQIEAVGGNPIATRLAGIRSDRVYVIVYILSAVLSGISGILEMGRAGVMDPNDLGNLKELDAIAAVAIGGTAMKGGKINMVGSVAGCIIMTLINATVNMNGVPAAFSNLIKAAIIILSLAIQRERKV